LPSSVSRKLPSTAVLARVCHRPQEAYSSLLDSLNNTVKLGHNNSLLVMGPRGSGKTLVSPISSSSCCCYCNAAPVYAAAAVVLPPPLLLLPSAAPAAGASVLLLCCCSCPAAAAAAVIAVAGLLASLLPRAAIVIWPTTLPPHLFLSFTTPRQMTERALAAMEAQWNRDPRDPVVGVIRLSGLCHAEERCAFREIARQLCE
jgi:hypothetical protein